MTDKDLQETRDALLNYREFLQTAPKSEVLKFLASTGRYDSNEDLVEPHPVRRKVVSQPKTCTR